MSSRSSHAAIAAVMGVLSLAALVPSLWPVLDLWLAARFIGESAPWADWAQLDAIEFLNRYTPALARTAAALGGLAFAVHWWRARLGHRGAWRQAIAGLFVGLGLLLGPGGSVTAIKDVWNRARPLDVQAFGGDKAYTPALQPTDQCNRNCAFVSGHVACGFFMATLFMLGGRRRWWWLAGGVALGLLVGLGRAAAGAHWLSDILWAFPVTWATSWLLLTLMLRITPPAATRGQ